MWLIWGHAEVHAALKSSKLSVHTAGARLGGAGRRCAQVAEAVSRFLTRLNAPEHSRLRGLLLRAFTPRVVDRSYLRDGRRRFAMRCTRCLTARTRPQRLSVECSLGVPHCPLGSARLAPMRGD
jgi:cytochrome P450